MLQHLLKTSQGSCSFPSSPILDQIQNSPISCQLCPHCNKPGLRSPSWFMLPVLLVILVIVYQRAPTLTSDTSKRLHHYKKPQGRARIVHNFEVAEDRNRTESTPLVAVSTSEPKKLVIGQRILQKNRKPPFCGCTPGGDQLKSVTDASSWTTEH